jgi:hypothetical protein
MEYLRDDSERNALMAQLPDTEEFELARDIVYDGPLFKSGDEYMSYNVTEEYRDGFMYEDDDEEMIAINQITQAVKEMGGKVEYGYPDIKFVYTIAPNGDLIASNVNPNS